MNEPSHVAKTMVVEESHTKQCNCSASETKSNEHCFGGVTWRENRKEYR